MTSISLVGLRGVTGVVVASMERRRNPPNTVGGFQYSEVNVTDDVAITAQQCRGCSSRGDSVQRQILDRLIFEPE